MMQRSGADTTAGAASVAGLHVIDHRYATAVVVSQAVSEEGSPEHPTAEYSSTAVLVLLVLLLGKAKTAAIYDRTAATAAVAAAVSTIIREHCCPSSR